MKKLFFLSFCLVFLFVVNGLSQSKKLKIPKPKKISKTKTTSAITGCVLPFSVIELMLDKTEVIADCLKANNSCSNSSAKVEVRTAATGDDISKFIYTVSAGKVVGEGANVIWDLTNVKPGNYTITAGISQPALNGTRWDVYGMMKTKVIIIKDCFDCQK